jgi:uncharacterized oxidoreductase
MIEKSKNGCAKIKAEDMTCLTAAIFRAHGVSASVARTVADSLVLANLTGHDSHGVQRVTQYLDWIRRGWIQPRGKLTVVRDKPNLLLVDGGFQFGQVIGRKATRMAMRKAKRGGFCLLSIRRSAHLGRMGEFAEIAAEDGFLFFSLTNTHGGGINVAPHGGREARLSANPVAAGAPWPGHAPLIMDMATAAIAEGKISVAKAKGERLPPDSVINSRGETTTDPADYYTNPPGALLPFAGHKGFALSVFCELFAGALSGAGCSKLGVDRVANAMLALLLDPRAFAGRRFYEREVGAFAQHVRSCPLRKGVSEILLPGEPEARERKRRQREGIFLPKSTWRSLTDAARAAEIAMPKVRYH